MDLELDPNKLYNKIGKIGFENAVRTDELPTHIQLTKPKKPLLLQIQKSTHSIYLK